MKTIEFRKIKSPTALAVFWAFFVPEPFGTCLMLIAAIWWSCLRLLRRQTFGTEKTDNSSADELGKVAVLHQLETTAIRLGQLRSRSLVVLTGIKLALRD